MDKNTCVRDLVDALDKCPTLFEKNGRDLCVSNLVEPIPAKIVRHDDRGADLYRIVVACLDHEGGIDSLIATVDWREKKSVHMNGVRECTDALKAVLEREQRERARGPIGPTEPSGAAAGAELEAGYALSIGISEYHKPEPADAVTNRFRDLSFAADDARAFHEILKTRGYRGPEPLLNEQATLRGIMGALDTLRGQCKDSPNPLVLIYFSGHGAQDSEGRHYLVPHDGVPDDLFATALWSKTFENALRLINTNRLVVFLDACHAAGIEGGHDKGPQTCDPSILLEEHLKEQRGRYLVASCMANQVARERDDGHGLFTHELLKLMKCKEEKDSEDEVIDLYRLFEELRRRVRDATGYQQEPWSNVEQRTPDILLAINQTRRNARISKELALLQAVHKVLEDRQHKQSEVIWFNLSRFIRDSSPKKVEPYQKYFRQRADAIRAPPDGNLASEVCDALLDYLENKEGGRALTAPPRPRAASARSEPTRPPAATSPAVPSRSPEQDASERVTAKRPSMSGGLPTSARLSDRRWLPLNDIESLLAMVRQRGKLGQVGKMKKLLIDGTSEREFKTYLESTCGDADQSWIALVDELGASFDSHWPNACKRGAWACSLKDIKLPTFADRLRQRRSIDMLVVEILPIEIGEAITEYQGERPDLPLAEALAHCLNTLIHGPTIWEQCANGIELRRETDRIHSQNPQGENLAQLNRMLLEDAYPGGFEKPRRVEDQLILRRSRASVD
jgi:Caspase domain/Effector-associated domain 2